MESNDAISWHSQLAEEFDLYYNYSCEFIERYEIWTKLIDAYSNIDNCVLDIGCGTGIFSFYAARKNGMVIGIDASDEMIAVCTKKKRLSNLNNILFIKADIMSLKRIIEDKVGLILCSSVLEYVDNFNSSMEMLCSLLNDNGILIFSLPNRSSLYRKIEPIRFKLTGKPAYYKYVKNIFGLHEVAEKLNRNGFQVMAHFSYAKTALLFKLFDKIGLSKYSDNLLLIVAKRFS